jgi:hypothetical protein
MFQLSGVLLTLFPPEPSSCASTRLATAVVPPPLHFWQTCGPRARLFDGMLNEKSGIHSRLNRTDSIAVRDTPSKFLFPFSTFYATVQLYCFRHGVSISRSLTVRIKDIISDHDSSGCR